MGLLDAYQDSTDTALDVMAKLPQQEAAPKPKRSAWTAIPRAVGAAVSELAGGALDMAGAFGQVQAAYGGASPFDTKEQRLERLDLADRLKTDGIDWRTNEAQGAYKFARNLRPDPLTAGTAENIVFGLTKGLTKATGAGVALGPVAGAAVFGGSEGAVTADDLAEQGVDFETRAKVGGVTAAINAAGMALPVAGQTLKQTVGLVVTGGPASFIAQQAASREILRNADYEKVAEQFDPLDPVGLTLATLLPAGFAAWAKGGQIKAALTKPAKAGKGAPDAAPVKAKADAVAPTQEQMDAVMVHNLTTARDAHLDTDAANSAVAKLMQEVEAERATKVDQPADAEIGTARPGTQDADLTKVSPQDTAAADPHAASLLSRVEDLNSRNPDAPVAMRDDGTPARLADELEAIRNDARKGTDDMLGADDAPLLKVAAECFLSMGAAA